MGSSHKTASISTLLSQILIRSHLPFCFLPSHQAKCCSRFSRFPLPNLKVMDSTFCILPSSFFSFRCITYLTIPCSAKQKREVIQLDYKGKKSRMLLPLKQISVYSYDSSNLGRANGHLHNQLAR